MNRFLCAVTTLTRLPVSRKFMPTEQEIIGSADFLPLVGCMIALILGGIAYGARFFLPNMLYAVLLTFLSELPTAGFHLDGLADTADGFMSSRNREKMLEIMHDSRIGSMGVLAIVFWALVKFAAWMTLIEQTKTDWIPYGVFLTALYGRCSLVWHLTFCRYARPEGLGKLVFSRIPRGGLVTAVLFACGSVCCCPKLYPLPVLLILWVGLWSLWCRHKIGGGTGDTLGACEELTELLTVFYLAVVL